jgi:hypothetical protein
MTAAIQVVDRERLLSFSFEDILRYHGGGSPGGVAHAYKVLERALPLLEPDGTCERRELVVETAFGGPGARDAFEMVTRGVTEDRFRIDPSLAQPDRGRALERFVFRLAYRDRSVTLVLREGFVTDEFIELARTDGRSAEPWTSTNPGGGTDIELWVAASATWLSGRSHSSMRPLHGPFAGAAAVVPPEPTKDATTIAISTAGTSAIATRRRLTALAGGGSGASSPCSSGRYTSRSTALMPS